MQRTYWIGILAIACCGCGGEIELSGPAPEWTEYESPDAEFTIKFPQPPTVTVQESLGRTQVEGGHQGMQCMVIFYEKRMTPEEHAEFIKKSQELEAGADGMKVVSATVEKRNGHDIVLVTEEGSLSDGSGGQVPHEQRRLFANANGYTIAIRANGSPEYFDDGIVQEFFDSFQPEALSPEDTQPKEFDAHGIQFRYPRECVVDSAEEPGMRAVSVQDADEFQLAGLLLETDAVETATEMLDDYRAEEAETVKTLGEDDYVVEDCQRTILGKEAKGLRSTTFPNSKNLKQVNETYFVDLGENQLVTIKVVTQFGTRAQQTYVDMILDSLKVATEAK